MVSRLSFNRKEAGHFLLSSISFTFSKYLLDRSWNNWIQPVPPDFSPHTCNFLSLSSILENSLLNLLVHHLTLQQYLFCYWCTPKDFHLHEWSSVFYSKEKRRYELCLFKNLICGAPGWLSWLSGRLQLGSWSRGPWVRAPCRALCWQLRAWSLFQILCLPLSDPPPFMLCLSLSQK